MDDQAVQEGPFLTPQQAADRLGLKKYRIYDLKNSGRLRYRQLGKNSAIEIPLSEVERLERLLCPGTVTERAGDLLERADAK